MNYWWVNQKQTHRQEIGGGYMWSPKFQVNNNKHFSYEFMKKIQPGDIIFSYADAAIVAVGVALTHCHSFPKPIDFSSTINNWSNEGWKVDVNYHKLAEPARTINHIDMLRVFLPEKYSPINSLSGSANQAYLFKINKNFALALAKLIDRQTVDLINGNHIFEAVEKNETVEQQIKKWEDGLQNEIQSSVNITETDKEVIIKARRGQGKFRALLLNREPCCRITGVGNPEHLIASHIKPWRSSSNEERIDPENGFMLTPTIDHLFDKGFISFENNGSVLLADVASRELMAKMGVIESNQPHVLARLTEQKINYLDWHRGSVFLG